MNGTLHAVTELNPDALAIAAELDSERANGTVRGWVGIFLGVGEVWLMMLDLYMGSRS